MFFYEVSPHKYGLPLKIPLFIAIFFIQIVHLWYVQFWTNSDGVNTCHRPWECRPSAINPFMETHCKYFHDGMIWDGWLYIHTYHIHHAFAIAHMCVFSFCGASFCAKFPQRRVAGTLLVNQRNVPRLGSWSLISDRDRWNLCWSNKHKAVVSACLVWTNFCAGEQCGRMM